MQVCKSLYLLLRNLLLYLLAVSPSSQLRLTDGRQVEMSIYFQTRKKEREWADNTASPVDFRSDRNCLSFAELPFQLSLLSFPGSICFHLPLPAVFGVVPRKSRYFDGSRNERNLFRVRSRPFSNSAAICCAAAPLLSPLLSPPPTKGVILLPPTGTFRCKTKMIDYRAISAARVHVRLTTRSRAWKYGTFFCIWRLDGKGAE